MQPAPQSTPNVTVDTRKRLSKHDERTPMLVIGVGGTGKAAVVELTRSMQENGMEYGKISDRTDKLVTALFIDGNRNEVAEGAVADPDGELLRAAGVRTIHLFTPHQGALLKRTGINKRLTKGFPSDADHAGCNGDRRVGPVRYALVRDNPNPAENPLKAVEQIVEDWKAVSNEIFLAKVVRVIVVSGMHGGTGPAALTIAADAVRTIKTLLPDTEVVSEMHMMDGESAQLDRGMRDGHERQREFNALVQIMEANYATVRGGVTLPDGTFVEGLPGTFMFLLGGQSTEKSVDPTDGHYQPAKQDAKGIIAGIMGFHTSGQRSNAGTRLNIPTADRDGVNEPLARFSVVGTSELLTDPALEILGAQKQQDLLKRATGLEVVNREAVSTATRETTRTIAITDVHSSVPLSTINRTTLSPNAAAQHASEVVQNFLTVNLTNLGPVVAGRIQEKKNAFRRTLEGLVTEILQRDGIGSVKAFLTNLKTETEKYAATLTADQERMVGSLNPKAESLQRKAADIHAMGNPQALELDGIDSVIAEMPSGTVDTKMIDGKKGELFGMLKIAPIVDGLDLPKINKGNLRPQNAADNAVNTVNTFLTSELKATHNELGEQYGRLTTEFENAVRTAFAEALAHGGLGTMQGLTRELVNGLNELKDRLERELAEERTAIEDKKKDLKAKAEEIKGMGKPSIIPVIRTRDEARINTAVDELITMADDVAKDMAERSAKQNLAHRLTKMVSSISTRQLEATLPAARAYCEDKINTAVDELKNSADELAKDTITVNAGKQMIETIEGADGLLSSIREIAGKTENIIGAIEALLRTELQPKGKTFETPFDLKVPGEIRYNEDPIALRQQFGNWSKGEMRHVMAGVQLKPEDVALLASLSGEEGQKRLKAMQRLSKPLYLPSQPGLDTADMITVRQVTVPTGGSVELDRSGAIVNPQGLPIPDGFTAYATRPDGRYVMTQETHGMTALDTKYFFDALGKFLKRPAAERNRYFTCEGDMERLLPPFARRLAEMQKTADGNRGEIVEVEEGDYTLAYYKTPEQIADETRAATAAGTRKVMQ